MTFVLTLTISLIPEGDSVPESGSEILQVASEKRAKEVVAWRKKQEEALRSEMEQAAIDQRRSDERETYFEARMARWACLLKFDAPF